MPQRISNPLPTPIPGNQGFYRSGSSKIGWSDIDQLEQQMYGTVGGTPVPAPTAPSPTPYTPFTDFDSYDGRNTGQLSDVTGPNSLGDVASGSGPTSGLNYYDAGNGITYVYDENWNYVRTENNPTPQQSRSDNPTNTISRNVGSYFNPDLGGFLPLGGYAISGPTMLSTTWSNANTGSPNFYAPRAIPANSGLNDLAYAHPGQAPGTTSGAFGAGFAAPAPPNSMMGRVVHV